MTRHGGGPADSPGFLLWHATLAWQRAIGSALAPLDLTHVQFVLLACTWWLSERTATPPSQRVLAEQAGTDVKMTSQVVRTLESKGLLTREVDARDSRARRVTLTRSGRRLARRAITVVEAVDDEIFAAGAEDLVAVLRRLPPISRA